MVLDGLKPEKVFYYFEKICNIPHGSGNTKMISDYLVSFAKEHNLEYVQDKHDNVVIKKAASSEKINSNPVIIQGHIDMVCQCVPEKKIDFAKEPISLKVDGNVIYADGTTLGGDDGIAVAFMLAILASDNLIHPPLECVFTSDEEIGLLGASDFDCSVLNGKMMLNIDSEEEGDLLVSCAGGATATCRINIERESVKGIGCEIFVGGLAGGHSGTEISKQGANADKLLGRLLYVMSTKYSFRIANIGGGDKDNAIPRAANATIIVDDLAFEKNSFTNAIKAVEEILKKEYSVTDRDMFVEIEYKEEKDAYVALTKEATNKIITSLYLLPNGIIKYSNHIKDLVETSLNLGILRLDEENAIFEFSVRSSVQSEKDELLDRLTCLMESIGGTVVISGEYPAWEYKEQSKLRDIMCDCYENMFGKKPRLLAIHAGLECGIFAGKIKDLDCVSFGPDITDIHTTEEKLYIDSVARMWEYTLKILESL